MRLKDVARIELGAQNYDFAAIYNGGATVPMGVYLQPGANALGTADRVMAEVEAIRAELPPGMDISIPYNPTEFVAARAIGAITRPNPRPLVTRWTVIAGSATFRPHRFMKAYPVAPRSRPATVGTR